MDISVTEFRAQCLELIRRVEAGGEDVQIRRHGRVVARLTPPSRPGGTGQPPWRVLRGSGVLQVEPADSVLEAQDFDALR